MQVISAESTELFTGPPDAPQQLVRIGYTGGPGGVRVDGDGLSGAGHAGPGDGSVEVAVTVRDPVVGQRRAARVVAGDTITPFDFTVAEPGWTMFMVSHFHYDPVWWNTQGAYTSVWSEDPPGRQTNSFNLVRAHLEMARREPEYKFVLAEVDYLKPFWDTHPEDRDDLRRFIDEGRVEIMGGTYNEPNTNLTSAETAIRNFVHGMGFQRHVLGASPETAWQLDVFGHDPQFPGMAADAGLTSSSWARGPHHQWGPVSMHGNARGMQFCSEFEWIAPSGRGLLTHYMPAHYGAGWGMDSSATLEEAEAATYRLFLTLKEVALTRNVLLPVGTDYTPPNKWVTDIHRDWNERYTWPRFVCAIPRDFFTAVRAELTERGIEPSPQTRDMNPIYTGCHVSYIDTKQANRAAEQAVLDAEKFAVFAGLIGGATYPQSAFAKAWVQLAYGAHHDGITGSESDQVYLDLLTSWRDAWELGTAARDNALVLLSKAVDGDVVVWNALAHKRSDVVTARLSSPVSNAALLDADGTEVPVQVGEDGRSISWVARDVPSLGWQSYRLTSGAAAKWEAASGDSISNEAYRLSVDPARGGGVRSLVSRASGRELISGGGVGNELAVYDEYPSHPQFGEGPWHLLPKGPVVASSDVAAEVQAYRGPLGERLVVRGRIGDMLRYTQTLTLWHGVARVDCRTVIDEFTGSDRLLRLRWPCAVPGALPVSEVGDAVIGRGFGLLRGPDGAVVDSATHPWTLDNPAFGWFGLSSMVRVRIGEACRAVSVAEVVAPTESSSAAVARELMVALVRAGVTATCSSADKPRYGDLAVDSNLPDTRIVLGGPGENAVTAAVLEAAEPAYAEELQRQLASTGRARVWVPARAPLATAWVPGADLRDVRVLPVLIVAGADLDAVVSDLVDDLGDFEIDVQQGVSTAAEPFESHTVALLNRGMPGFAVESDGTLNMSLMRSCSGWPSGTWIDPPRRTAPDGSNFQLQHWTHAFDYALVSGEGDWRQARIPARSAEFAHPLLAVAENDGAAGGLPPWGSMLEIDPADGVHLGALKAAGNPIACGSAQPVDPADGVAIRLVETCGATAEVVVRSGLRRVSAAARVDLLEQPRVQQATEGLTLHGYEIATVLTRLNLPQVLDEDHAQLAPDVEAAQPLYARYWLHNRGPAALGGLPAVAYLHPESRAVQPNSTVGLRLSIASDCTDTVLHGHVRLVCPPGWTADPAELSFMLPPGEHTTPDVVLTAPPDAVPGRYPVRAELALTGNHVVMPPSWRQVVEDVCIVTVGDAAGDLLTIVEEPRPVSLAAGDSARLTMTVGSSAHADLAVEAHLISPWGTWEWLGPSAIGAEVPARGTVDLGFDVAPPPWVESGRWWALIRVGGAGRLLYSEAVEVVVR